MDILKGKTLLIVDDEPDLRGPLVTEFEMLGCRVLEAGNGREAFDKIKEMSGSIDAVISDIRMPGGDGVGLLRKIKELDHAMPVVMLITGFSDLSRADAYHLGAEAILAKPFDLDEIDAAVVRILTPRETRWNCSEANRKIAKTVIEKTFTNLEVAKQNGQLQLGRGGLFVHIENAIPFPNEIVEIKIIFSEDRALSMEGSGIIRWSRHEDQTDLKKGCGIEFECLNAETRKRIIELTDALGTRAFIPNQ